MRLLPNNLTGELLHVDASLIRPDVNWESLAVRHVEALEQVNGDLTALELAKKESRQTGRYKKTCVTDPDASMAANARNRRFEPAYKQYAVVDDVRGVIIDVEVTTGETTEGQVVERIDAAAVTTGTPVKIVIADAGYAYGKVYGDLERRDIDPVIPAKAEPNPRPCAIAAVPMRCQARHTAMSARQNLAANPAGRARPLFLFQGLRLLALLAGVTLFVERPRQGRSGWQ